MPTGLVKSMIQASGRRARPHPLGHVQHDRHRPQRLGEAAGPGRLLADAAALQRPGLVPVAGGLAADAKLEQYRARAVDGRVQVGRSTRHAAGCPYRAMIRAENGPTTDSRSASGSTSTSSVILMSPVSLAIPSTSSGV